MDKVTHVVLHVRKRHVESTAMKMIALTCKARSETLKGKTLSNIRSEDFCSTDLNRPDNRYSWLKSVLGFDTVYFYGCSDADGPCAVRYLQGVHLACRELTTLPPAFFYAVDDLETGNSKFCEKLRMAEKWAKAENKGNVRYEVLENNTEIVLTTWD